MIFSLINLCQKRPEVFPPVFYSRCTRFIGFNFLICCEVRVKVHFFAYARKDYIDCPGGPVANQVIIYV